MVFFPERFRKAAVLGREGGGHPSHLECLPREVRRCREEEMGRGGWGAGVIYSGDIRKATGLWSKSPPVQRQIISSSSTLIYSSQSLH